MPLPLEDRSEGPGADPLTQGDLTLGDLPVVTGVPPPQGFLFHRTHSQQVNTQRGEEEELSRSLTILLRSSEEEDDLRSLCWHGNTLKDVKQRLTRCF